MESLRSDDRKYSRDACIVHVLGRVDPWPDDSRRRIRPAFHLGLRRKDHVGADIDEEIAFHLQERVDALVARGWSEADAMAEAKRLFGDPKAARPALFAAATVRNRRARLARALGLDLRRHEALSARQLRHAPTFAVGVIIAIALGIGANATMFSVIDRLMLRAPAGIAAPAEVYTFVRVGHERGSSATSYPAVMALRDNLARVATIATESFASSLSVGFGTETRPERTVFVDGEYFPVLGAHAALGRLLARDDMQLPDGFPVAVISYGLWQREFGGDRNVIGRDLIIGEQRLRIVGVAARDFNSVGIAPLDLWLPITLATKLTFVLPQWSTGVQRWVFPIARLRPGVNPALVAQRATTLRRALERTLPRGDTTTAIELQSILPSRAPVLSPEAKIAALLGAVSLLVLIVACFNAANLMLARAVRREREIAIRVALGVSRRRLVRQLVIDSLLLSTLGAVAAIGIAALGGSIMRGVLLQGFVWSGSLVDARTLGFIGVTAVIAALLTCVFPTLLLVRRFDVGHALSHASVRQAGRAHRPGFISLLVVAQTVLSALLLIGALLFVRSLTNVRRVPVGIDVDHVAIAMLDPKNLRADGPAVDARFTDLAARASRIPGVTGVTIAEGAPFSVYETRLIAVPGLSPELDAIKNGTLLRPVAPNYFATIGTRIVQGRTFTAAEDRADGEQLAIINASMAAMLWPNGDAMGKCVQVAAREPATSPCRRIIGIAEDLHEQVTNLDSRESASIYVPLNQGGHLIEARAVVVRTATESAPVARQLRLAALNRDASIALGDVFTIQSKLDPELRPWKLGATMFGAFGLLALVLAALGAYSMFAYSVAQRTQEMGVRIALGARTRDILALIGKEGAVLATVGVMIAMTSAAVLAPFVQPLLFQTPARSVGIYLSVAIAMLAVAIAASLVPAWRGARVDPLTAIRAE